MKKLMLLPFITANLLMANLMFVSNVKSPLLDEVSKQEVGEIYEGSPVKVLENLGDFSLIEVSGEISKENENTLAYKKEPLITFLKLNKEVKNVEKFLIKTSDLTNNALEAWEEVELTYYDTCSSCHAAHKPKEHKMSEWDAYLSAMQSFAKINDNEKARLLRFLQAFASDGIVKE